MEGRTCGRTYAWVDGRTVPHIEMRGSVIAGVCARTGLHLLQMHFFVAPITMWVWDLGNQYCLLSNHRLLFIPMSRELFDCKSNSIWEAEQ